MSDQPFKFRHLDVIVGAFVLGSVAIIVVALFLIGSARQWFTARTVISAATPHPDPARADFLEELAESLRPGTPVEFAGTVVGKVQASQAEDGHLRLWLDVANRTLEQLHQGDARAVIKVPIAPFMGQTRVVLKAGSTGDTGWLKDSWHEFRDLEIGPPRDSTAMAIAVLRDLEANLGPMLTSVTALLVEGRSLLADIRDQRLPQQAGDLLAGLREQRVPERLDALLARIEAIAAETEAAVAQARGLATGVAEGGGLAGRLLFDAALGRELAAMAADLAAIVAELRRAAPAAPALADGAHTLLDEVQRLVDGLNRHWLLRSYTAPGDGVRLIPPGIIEAPTEAGP